MASEETPNEPARSSRTELSFARTLAEERLGEDGLDQLSRKASAYADWTEGKGLVVALLSKYAIWHNGNLPICWCRRDAEGLPYLQAVLTRQTITVGLKDTIDM